MKISLCMIVKNEENNIISCLDRALKIVDEAIIVDTGSTDRTKELILENYACNNRVKFIEYIWENDFSKARNQSLKYAKGDWILVLDADERIFTDIEKLKQFLNSTDKISFTIPVYNVIDKENNFLTPSTIKLYKNRNPRYEGAINEQILLDNERVVPNVIDAEICKIIDGQYSQAIDFVKTVLKDPLIREIPDIYSIKGAIAMLEGNIDKAEEVLNEGILEDSNNNDLLYNIAYLYKTIGSIDKSIYFYKKLYYRTENQDDKKRIEEEIKSLGGDIKNRVLIGSPVHQKPQILKEFLQSIKELSKENLVVDYFFIDDNSIIESSEILNQFSIEEGNVYIQKSEYRDEYICDDNTHNWKENLVWKVAGFKDNIINYAKDNNYDYLFFIDSDLVLHPDTLRHLISTGKNIISEIFWTKWNINSPELPQVWLQDTYIQYKASRGEQLSQVEIYNRHMEFINELRVPGIYEVGGLGACTLISKYAMDKGVSFREIKNLSFWGEDRHFCIRATAIGLSLYVDTHYPAYHIYRESDLEGVNEYKKK